MTNTKETREGFALHALLVAAREVCEVAHHDKYETQYVADSTKEVVDILNDVLSLYNLKASIVDAQEAIAKLEGK